ncbi:hypothetical protein ACIRRA_08445 [Nocardia sp. NPDC101769]|uniref:hypothetical protein n=1 Tax=Nocardia sp. NPDC101769 TaxID=3364333 RepID=UPI00382BB2F1
MIRKTILVITAGILIGAPMTATAGATQPEVATEAVVGAQDVALSTGSGVADAVINGLITAIFGPDDPSKCTFPYCF